MSNVVAEVTTERGFHFVLVDDADGGPFTVRDDGPDGEVRATAHTRELAVATWQGFVMGTLR